VTLLLSLGEGNLISPLEVNIGDYFHIEQEKWEIVGLQFDCAPIYDTDREDEVGISLTFIYDDIPIDTLGNEDHYFSLHERGQLVIIDSPFWENPIFDTNGEALAPTFIPCDFGNISKSFEPLKYDFQETSPIEYNTSSSPSPFLLVHHFESSTSDSLTLVI